MSQRADEFKVHCSTVTRALHQHEMVDYGRVNSTLTEFSYRDMVSFLTNKVGSAHKDAKA